MATLEQLPGFEPAPADLEPVAIEIVRVCHFVMKPCGLCGKPKSNPVHRKKNVEEGKPFCGFRRKLGCATCGLPKAHADHVGAPDSFNVMAGRDPNVYRAIVDKWRPVLTAALEASGLPKGLDGVVVEAEVSFGDNVERDRGNHAVMLDKALGDALVAGGWLTKDSWSRYGFGELQRREAGKANRTRLMIFPRAPKTAATSAVTAGNVAAMSSQIGAA